MNKPNESTPLNIPYETNPFRIGSNGVIRLFSNNQPVAIAIIAINLFLLIFNNSLAQRASASSGFRSFAISLGFSGISAFVSLCALHVVIASLRSKTVKLGEVLGLTAEHFLTYLGFFIVYGLIVIGGLILLVIPGIVFSIWYSLIFYARFNEGLGLRQSLRRSKQLVKGREVEFLAVNLVGGVYSLFGLAGPAITSAVSGEWYGQLATARDKGEELPKVNKICYFIIFAVFLIVAAVISAIIAAAVKQK